MTDVFQALRNIAPKLNELREDPAARVRYELMSDGLAWSDELPPWEHLEPGECHCLRAIWRYRASLIMGNPDEKFRPYWQHAQSLFPNWPGFNILRQDQRWQSFFTERREKSLRAWGEADNRYTIHKASEIAHKESTAS